VISSDVFRPPPPPSAVVASPPGGSTPHDPCCRNLTSLLLGENRFVDVASVRLGDLPSLRSVDLYGNAVASLRRDSFGAANSTTTTGGGFASVEQLNLGLNVVEKIEDGAFDGLRRLRVLYLDGNRFSADRRAESRLATLSIHRPFTLSFQS